jgi:hypothetical protein
MAHGMGIGVSPNIRAVYGRIVVTGNDLQTSASVRVFDLAGKTVAGFNGARGAQACWSSGLLLQGSYIVEVMSANGTVTTRHLTVMQDRY